MPEELPCCALPQALPNLSICPQRGYPPPCLVSEKMRTAVAEICILLCVLPLPKHAQKENSIKRVICCCV